MRALAALLVVAVAVAAPCSGLLGLSRLQLPQSLPDLRRVRRGWFSSDPTPSPAPYDSCVCVPFPTCLDGNIVQHGADLLDVKLGPRKQCSGFRVCCDVPRESLQRLQATPGLQPGVMSSIPVSGLGFLSSDSGSQPPAVLAGGRPCVCVSSYLCQGGEILPSQQQLLDMRQVSHTGRCSYGDQVCCAVPSQQILTTPPPAPCTCVRGDHCRQQDVLTRYSNPTIPVCPGTQVCCSRPLPISGAGGAYPGSAVVPDPRRPDYDVYRFCKQYPLSVACFSTHQVNFLPTIRPSPYFNANADAERLNKAFRWFNTDETVLIEVLTKRTFAERAEIKRAYANLYGKDLYKAVSGTKITRGKFENLMRELLEADSYYKYLARKLHEGMDGIGTDEDVVLETLISSTPEEIAAIKPHFTAIEGKTLEGDLKDDLTGDLEDIMVALANGTRDRSFHVDPYKARDQAKALYQAGGGRLGTEESTFKYYLTHENYAQLALIFAEYERLAGEPFEEALEDEFSHHVEDATQAIVEVTKNLPRYFAGRLHDALWDSGFITKDDSSLRRILISRAERDLGSIAREYQLRYGRTLIDDIEKRTTGDYEDALVSLCGGQS